MLQPLADASRALSPAERWIPGSIGILTFASAAVYFAWLVFLSFRSKSWATAAGTITSCQKRKVFQGKNAPGARAAVSYTFRVDGREFGGHQIRFGGDLNVNIGHAEDDVAKYGVGTAVTVHYDPKAPKRRSTLEQRASKLVYLFLALAAIATATVVYGVATGT